MRKWMLLTMAVSLSASLSAQVEKDTNQKFKQDANKEFEEFMKQADKEFEDFRTRANEEYANFMEEAWAAFPVMPAEELPMRPKPVRPLEAEDAPVTNAEIYYEEVEGSYDWSSNWTPSAILSEEANPIPSDRPNPVSPILPVFETDATVQNLFFYGSSFPFHVEREKPFKLKNVSEKTVAKQWKKMSTSYYSNIVGECLQHRNERGLCDWAYIGFCQSVAEKYCGENTNEAVLLQMYILTQSGYQMRLARVGEKLTLLFGSTEKIFRYKYFLLDGLKFYILDKSLENSSMNIFDRAFPNEKALSLAVTQPHFNLSKTKQRTLTSTKYPDVKITIETNRNLIDFYDDYPISANWVYYTKASLSEVMKESLYPALRQAIKGKSERDAADIILNLVQTGLAYKTDAEQFGYERPLYPDESLYYPYCDCEDRSILFSCLIRELLGLDVVLLNYPEHITTAVHFNEDVKGDFLTIDGKTYVICEPTFIKGGSVGKSAKKYRDVKPVVIKI